MAISYWLWLFIGTDFVCERLFGFRFAIVDGTIKDSLQRSSLLETE